MKLIDVTFDPVTGDPKVATSGFSGGECKTATDALEKALGVVVSDKTTAEFHNPGGSQHQQQVAQ